MSAPDGSQRVRPAKRQGAAGDIYCSLLVDADGALIVTGDVGGSGGGAAGGLTDGELRASPVVVAVSNMVAAAETGLAKDATFAKNADGGIRTHVENFPATQPVTGPLTDSQLRAAAVPVSMAAAPVTPVTDGGGSLTVDGTVALDAATLAALESITVVDGGGSLTVDGTVSISGTVPVSGPLTDTQLRAAPLPVSGTVTISDGAGPVTVDGTVAVSNMIAAVETGLAKDATLTARLPTALDADGGIKVHVQSAVPITDNGGLLSVDDGGGSITVDGTFWPATQPVSLAALPSLAAGSSVIGKVQNQDAAGNNIETTTKGTQAARALATQDMRDTGRALVVATAEAVAGVNADTIVSTFAVNRAGTVAAAQTSINVTAGKTLRILQILVGYMVVTATTPPWLRVRARYNPAGAAVLSSPMLASLRVGPAAVVVNHTTWTNMEIPEGLELAAGAGLAFSISGPATTPANGNVDIVVVGYEY